jgi:two-component system, sensor histidine kinase RegB
LANTPNMPAVPPRPAAEFAPSPENLKRLVVLRWAIIAVLLIAVFAARRWLHLHAPIEPVLATIGAMAVLNAATQLRLRFPWPLARFECLGQIVADVALLGAFCYFSGGPANPLVSLLLLPLIVAAIMLRPLNAWLVAGLSGACYSLVVFFHEPLEQHVHYDEAFGHGSEAVGFDLHLSGMWLTFMLSAMLVAAFLTRMAQSLRQRDQALARAREEALRNERIVALGTLAAGAAHELATPLGNLVMLSDELARRHADDPDSVEDLADLRAQVAVCKGILGDMVAAAGGTRAEGGRLLRADEFIDEVRAKWQLIRPQAHVEYVWTGPRPAAAILAEQTFVQALLNLLNNAADAAPDRTVEVAGRCDAGQLLVEIRDRGPGLTPEVLARAGEAFFTTKAAGKGLGIGLFLANATIERAGGTVRLHNREGGGAVTVVTLPLAETTGDKGVPKP